MPFYHATTDHLGDHVTFTDGGYYEQITDGTPDIQYSSAGFIGFEQSDVPEVAASRSPSAALFGKLQGVSRSEPSPDEFPLTAYIYEIHSEPDIIIESLTGDFELLEEVRYRNPSESPVEARLAQTVEVPLQAVYDIGVVYVPPSPHIIEYWGQAVKDGLEHLVDTREYPAPISNYSGRTRPDLSCFDLTPDYLNQATAPTAETT